MKVKLRKWMKKNKGIVTLWTIMSFGTLFLVIQRLGFNTLYLIIFFLPLFALAMGRMVQELRKS